MSKRQNKHRNFRYYLGAMIFTLLVIGYSNCSDIKIMGNYHAPSTMSNDTPLGDPKADTVNFDPSKATKPDSMSSQICAQGSNLSDLWFWYPTNVPQTVLFGGVEYPLKIVGGLFSSADCISFKKISFEGWAPRDLRHLEFYGVYSFRIKTSAKLSILFLSYSFQNNAGPLGDPDYYFSISKVPGEFKSAPNSKDYCNLGSSSRVYVVDQGSNSPFCTVYQDSIYYFNVLHTNYAPAEGSMGGRMLLNSSTRDCTNDFTSIYCKNFHNALQ